MDLLKVKAESLPKRCEVCHQADYFDAPTNICTIASLNELLS